MKVLEDLLWLAAILLGIAAAIGVIVLIELKVEADNPRPRIPERHEVSVSRVYGPDEFGIACYRGGSSHAVACVRVAAP